MLKSGNDTEYMRVLTDTSIYYEARECSHIVKWYGVLDEKDSIWIVMQHCVFGDFYNILNINSSRWILEVKNQVLRKSFWLQKRLKVLLLILDIKKNAQKSNKHKKYFFVKKKHENMLKYYVKLFEFTWRLPGWRLPSAGVIQAVVELAQSKTRIWTQDFIKKV